MKVCFFLFIVISVICMSILKVSCSAFLNWVCWARGNFLASRVGPGRAGPVRLFLGNPLIRLAGLYWLFLSPWHCSGVYVCD